MFLFVLIDFWLRNTVYTMYSNECDMCHIAIKTFLLKTAQNFPQMLTCHHLMGQPHRPCNLNMHDQTQTAVSQEMWQN